MNGPEFPKLIITRGEPASTWATSEAMPLSSEKLTLRYEQLTPVQKDMLRHSLETIESLPLDMKKD